MSDEGKRGETRVSIAALVGRGQRTVNKKMLATLPFEKEAHRWTVVY